MYGPHGSSTPLIGYVGLADVLVHVLGDKSLSLRTSHCGGAKGVTIESKPQARWTTLCPEQS